MSNFLISLTWKRYTVTWMNRRESGDPIENSRKGSGYETLRKGFDIVIMFSFHCHE